MSDPVRRVTFSFEGNGHILQAMLERPEEWHWPFLVISSKYEKAKTVSELEHDEAITESG